MADLLTPASVPAYVDDLAVPGFWTATEYAALDKTGLYTSVRAEATRRGWAPDDGMRLATNKLIAAARTAWEAANSGSAPVTAADGYVVISPGRDGVVGDGSTNDGAAIQALATANPGRTLLLRASSYNVNGVTLTLPNNTSIKGEGRRSSILTQTNANTAMVVLGENSGISDMGLRHLPGVNPTSGAMIYSSAGARTLFEKQVGWIENVWLDSPWEGIRLDSGQAVSGPTATCLIGGFLKDIIINGLWGQGIVFRDVADAHLSKCWIDGGTGGSTKRGNGIRFDGFNEGVEIVGAEVIYCNNGLFMQGYPHPPSAVLTVGQRNSGVFVSNSYFDTCATDSAYLDRVSKTVFSNCWFAGAVRNGLTMMDECWGNRFVGCTFYGNQTYGLSTALAVTPAYSLHLSVADSIFSDNAVGGVHIGAGALRFNIRGNQFGTLLGPPSLGYGTPQYGVRVAAGASDFYTISENIQGTSGHTTAFISDGGTGVNKFVGNNYG